MIIGVLIELREIHPKYTMARHLATALEDVKNLFTLTDQELLYSLQKYKDRIALDRHHPESEIDKIIKEGMNLHNILEEDEDGSY